MIPEPEPNFLRRFEQIRASMARHQARLGLAATLLAASAGIGLLAWADHRYELPRAVRAAGLAVATLASAAVMARWLVGPLRWWTQPRTAVEIEGRFPELGQRIRTVVQYGGQPDELVASEGVAPTLVEALERETDERSAPLPLDRIVRRGRARALGALAAVPVALLAFAAIRDPEWRTALQRVVLIERPYTTIEVTPGDVLVDQGADVSVSAELKGRPRWIVSFETRPVGKKDAPWKSEHFLDLRKGNVLPITAKVEKIKEPLEYRFVVDRRDAAGPFKVDVRYPLAIKAIEVKLTPPAYTGLEPKTTKGGDVQGVEGSTAAIRIAFDAAPSEAALEMVELAPKSARKGEPAPSPTVVPLKREGDALVATLDLAKDLDYRVVARTADGRVLPKNKYRIDVREDRAPRVVFEEPGEALEVHPIAEVRHRVRADDDFGIARAGIVFRFNDGEEKTLILKEFAPTKGKKPTTATTLEEMLLMETLAASPQDSVTYYAFAEDNFPINPRRTETDLRYIDIRPFKREYKLAQPGSGEEGDPSELATLDELIARQRFNLNRATRLARHKPTDRTAAEDPLKIAGFEETLLNMAREFTEGIEALADRRVDALHKALDAMQASVDALDRSRNDEAPPAMAEALKNLVAARRELATFIGEDSALARAMRQFDRKQAQKIRKPKGKDREAEEIADRLEELADEEDLVYATIAMNEGGTVADAPDGQKPADMPKDQPSPPAQPKAEGDKGQDTPKADGDKGKEGPKGEGDPGKDGAGGPKPFDRGEVAAKQQRIADEVRDLEEKLKQLEAASDLAKARMARAAAKVEKASGALDRGNTKEAAQDAKVGAGMLHELARQVKGEIAREAADQLAMARDLAEELAGQEADLANRAQAQAPPAGPGEAGQDPKPGQGPGDKEGKGEKPGTGPGRGAPGIGDGRTQEEQIARMAEAARTLEEWLKQIEKRGEGKAAEAVREILDQGEVAEVVERADRMGEAQAAGKAEEVGREAKEQADKLEVLARSLDLVHRGIVAPELAAMVELDRRLAELMARLDDMKTDAQVEAWRRDAILLIRDLEKAGVDGGQELADLLVGGWHWDADHRHLLIPGPALVSLRSVTVRVKDRIQEMILKDLAAARDEATPPMFRELVDRYYQVLSQGAVAR